MISICRFMLIAAFFLYGTESQLIIVVKTLTATLGSQVQIDCDTTGLNASYVTSSVLWYRRRVGQTLEVLASGTTLIPAFTSTHGVSVVSSSVIRLTIYNVTSAEYSTFYHCLDYSGLINITTVEIASTAKTVCETGGQKAFKATPVRVGKSFTLECPLGSALLQNIVWGKIKTVATTTTADTIFSNSTLVDHRSYSISNTTTTSTLTVNSASTGTEFFMCIDPVGGGMPGDLALFAVCSSSKIATGIVTYAMMAIILLLQFIKF